MNRLFLHGGGDHPEYRAATFGRFAEAALAHGAGPIVLVAAEADLAAALESAREYAAIFEAIVAPPERLALLAVTEDQPPAEALAELRPSGVFICGGLTPRYHAALCQDQRWLAPVRAGEAIVGGTSAGAAIASAGAILGGWRIARAGAARAMLFQGASEGLDPLTVAPGLGLVPFAVDVHASQWGTLIRLIHAVESGAVAEGWAIDEDTLLEISGAEVAVYGRGQAYHVRPADGGVRVEIVAGM